MAYEFSASVITPTTGFMAPIADAYSFRCLMDFIGATVSEVKFSFENKTITMKQQDSYGTILHSMEVATTSLVDYYLNPEYESVSIGVDMRSLRGKIKNAQKKQTVLTLFNNLDVPTEFYATFKVPNKSNVPMSIIPTLRLKEAVEVELPDYGDAEPSLVVQVVDLSSTFGHIANSKCNYAELVCYQKGVLITGIVNGRVDAVQTLGKCANTYTVGEERAAEMNGAVVARYTISNTNIKPFAKINNVSPASATLRIYYAAGLPLRIVFPIGTIGTHQVFMASVDPKSMKPTSDDD
jgi:hypothetical protein